MARWREDPKSATFEDMPRRLRPAEGESREQVAARHAWLEAHNLAVVDYITWRAARRPGARLQPPSRRKLMSAADRAELDRRLEREGRPRW